MQQYPRHLASAARRLRSDSTDAERLLWRHLRGKQMFGVRFYRQRPVLDYVVDFYCPRARIVIELDGDSISGNRGWRRIRFATAGLKKPGSMFCVSTTAP